jgi:hypothetical protein
MTLRFTERIGNSLVVNERSLPPYMQPPSSPVQFNPLWKAQLGLFLCGYKILYPDEKTAWADFTCARLMICEYCRKKGCLYHPFHEDHGSYRALAECRSCGHCMEF